MRALQSHGMLGHQGRNKNESENEEDNDLYWSERQWAMHCYYCMGGVQKEAMRTICFLVEERMGKVVVADLCGTKSIPETHSFRIVTFCPSQVLWALFTVN